MFGKRKKTADFDIMPLRQNDGDSRNDAELLADFSKGDERAFERLYYRYRNLLYAYLNKLCSGNATEADEVFEETWLRVIDKAPKYRDKGKFSAWLFRISHNIFIDRLRKNKPDMNMPLEAENMDDSGTEISPERALGATDTRLMIEKALQELQPEQREVFLLREMDELSFKDIADIQKCSVNTVLSRMRYALKNLRSFLTNVDSGGLL